MKAEELRQTDLRIGNIVNYKYFNPNPENPEYFYTKAIIRGVYENSIRISFHNQKRIEKVSKVYGIPLSEEVLLKCGFEINGKYYRSKYIQDSIKLIYDFNQRILYFKYKGEFSPMIQIPRAIESLHELQNIYYTLTDEELEIHL